MFSRKRIFTSLSFIITSLCLILSCGDKGSPTNPTKDQQKLPPTARLSANPTSGEAPLLVSFNASASSDQDGEIASYRWDFGDGSSIGFGISIEHTYLLEGKYTVILAVTDNDSLKNSNSLQISVTAPAGPTLFPMYLGAQWAYDVVVYYKPLTENSGSTEYGKITATVSEYDAENIQAKLAVKGDLDYFTDQYFPITIPKQVYIRETATRLERAESPAGPWEISMNFSGSSWTNGGLIFAGSNYRAFSQKSSAVTTPAGVFSGYLVGAEEDNWGDTYKTDDHEYYWKELFNLDFGLIWSKYYIYFDDKGDQFGPSITSQEIALTGYAIPLPSGTLLAGGSGASVQLIVTCSPGAPYPADSPPVVTDRNAQIHLWFSMEMNRESVQPAFGVGVSLSPKSPPLLYAKAGSIVWEDNQHATWTPNEPFTVTPPRKTYVFAQLDTGAHSISGTYLSEQIRFIFAIE
jgi:PKD repeat protein